MKKIIIAGLLAFALGINANAQRVINNNYDSSIGSSRSEKSVEDLPLYQGGVDLQYHAVEHGWGIGAAYGVDYFLFGYDYLFGETNDYVTSNDGMQAFVGGNYRHHISNNLYVEGRIYGGLRYWSFQLKGSDSDSTYKGFFGVSPRLGIDFGRIAISGGYRWDFIDFKTDKEHTSDYFNIGITFAL